MNIVIVESAAKAKTINKYLGSDYKVIASFGHVRDLPSKNGAVEPDEDFAMHWEADSKSAKILKEITQAVKGADKLILATDPDREGEAISWHILQVLEKKKALKNVEVERVAFNAVTKQAIFDALKHPRELDSPLVSAYLARRALDYLVGFTLSPVLWRKLPGSRSAGRVQSVALRLICERELEIEIFKSKEYWSITTDLTNSKKEKFQARLVTAKGKKLGKYDIPDEKKAAELKAAIDGAAYKVENVESKAQRRHPYAPFTTSTLQQEASRKLGFGAKRTMQVAQKLYEGIDIGGETQGLITYMRTDGVQIVPEAVHSCRSVISKEFGDQYLPEKPRAYKTKAKNAQEAHEAVRPTDLTRQPKFIRKHLNDDEFKLYNLIWQRTIASQMESAEFLRTTVDIAVAGNDSNAYGVRANGSVLKFDGFLKLYEEGRDDTGDDEDGNRLPMMEKGEDVKCNKVESKQHFTEPPPRYTEATIVKKMEELGIGRPSTYASTLSVLQDRDYVRLDKKRLIPEDKGRLVTAFLENFFEKYVQYDFTAALEEQLDQISDGKLLWKQVLHDFWEGFTEAVKGTSDLRIAEVLDTLNEVLGPHVFPDKGDGADPRECPACKEGQISLKVSRNGAFVGCTRYPDCKYTRQLSSNGEEDPNEIPPEGMDLGVDPETGKVLTLKKGRFGPYIQIEADEGEKPKNVSVPKGYDVTQMTLEYALKLAALPRVVGQHPETGKDILAGFGPYGPYVRLDRTYANLPGAEDVFTVGLNHAVTLIADKQKSGKGRGGASAAPLKELGEHPELGGPVEIRDGRYGPYIKHGKINATIPKSSSPEAITMEEAVALIAAKAEKSGKKTTAKKTTAKKTAAKKTTTKKSTTKKTTAAKKTTTKKTTAKKTTAKKKAASETDEEKPKTTKKPAARKTAASTKKKAAAKTEN